MDVYKRPSRTRPFSQPRFIPAYPVCIMPTSGRVQPSSLNDVEDYISTKHHLDTPLVFENKTDSFNKYICCGPTGWLGSMIIGAFFALPFVPIKLCCPAKLSQHFLLMVRKCSTDFGIC